MKKKNLIVLLIIPFLISTLTIVTVNVSYNLIDVDISHIQWDFNEIEAFQHKEGNRVVLSAVGVNNRNHQISDGNSLVWRVENKDAEDTQPLAAVSHEGGTFYLNTLGVGEVIVTCANSKGTVSRSFTAILYKEGVVYLSPVTAQSNQGKVDPVNYYGEYDLAGGEKVAATVSMQLVAVPASMLETVSVSASGAATLEMDMETASTSGGRATVVGKAAIREAGKASFAVESSLGGEGITLRGYDITVVDEGVNVYTFADLMDCTNFSEEGEIVVLQTSFVAATENGKYGAGEVCFGEQKKDGSVDLRSVVEYIPTEYHHGFLDQWNEATSEDMHMDATVCVGLHVKKDMYGNGHMINFHNLAYPSASVNGVPTPGANDLFRGPLPFYTVGNPRGAVGSDLSNMNLISVYGQDNIGMYVDGDSLYLNDVVVKNCDDVSSLSFLGTVGTVVEVHGDNVELRNMRLSNGRQVLRSFSNDKLLVRNCRLSNARNFLFVTGANEYATINSTVVHALLTANGEVVESLTDYLAKEAEGDVLLREYLDGTAGVRGQYGSKARLTEALTTLQRALTDESVRGQWAGSTEILDCSFYRSGLTSIALETLFNGPFLHSPESPTNIAPFFALLNNMLVGTEFTPKQMGGTAYPVKVNLSGKTKFYDYKTWDEFDVSGLINESISVLVRELLGKEGYSIDNIFPIKRILQGMPFEYVQDGVSKVNIPILFYGGGANYSQVTTVGLSSEVMIHLNGATHDSPIDTTEVDLLSEYLVLPPVRPSSIGSSGAMGGLLSGLEVDQNTLIKTVTLVVGYEPFQFVFAKGGYLIGEVPSMAEMQQNALTY